MEGVDEEEDGIGMDELKASLAEVRSKKTILKGRHKLKGKLITSAKRAKVDDMIEHFEKIGVPVNKESLRSRSKSVRRIGNLEDALDRRDKAALDSDDGEMPIDDDKLADKEAETRGRKRRRDRSVNPDDYMDVDDEDADAPAGMKKRNLTPSQRTISAQKIIRSKTKDRREGSEPKRLPYKLVPEE